jgi:hypothetical protein
MQSRVDPGSRRSCCAAPRAGEEEEKGPNLISSRSRQVAKNAGEAPLTFGHFSREQRQNAGLFSVVAGSLLSVASEVTQARVTEALKVGAESYEGGWSWIFYRDSPPVGYPGDRFVQWQNGAPEEIRTPDP